MSRTRSCSSSLGLAGLVGLLVVALFVAVGCEGKEDDGGSSGPKIENVETRLGIGVVNPPPEGSAASEEEPEDDTEPREDEDRVADEDDTTGEDGSAAAGPALRRVMFVSFDTAPNVPVRATLNTSKEFRKPTDWGYATSDDDGHVEVAVPFDPLGALTIDVDDGAAEHSENPKKLPTLFLKIEPAKESRSRFMCRWNATVDGQKWPESDRGRKSEPYEIDQGKIAIKIISPIVKSVEVAGESHPMPDGEQELVFEVDLLTYIAKTPFDARPEGGTLAMTLDLGGRKAEAVLSCHGQSLYRTVLKSRKYMETSAGPPTSMMVFGPKGRSKVIGPAKSLSEIDLIAEVEYAKKSTKLASDCRYGGARSMKILRRRGRALVAKVIDPKTDTVLAEKSFEPDTANPCPKKSKGEVGKTTKGTLVTLAKRDAADGWLKTNLAKPMK